MIKMTIPQTVEITPLEALEQMRLQLLSQWKLHRHAHLDGTDWHKPDDRPHGKLSIEIREATSDEISTMISLSQLQRTFKKISP